MSKDDIVDEPLSMDRRKGKFPFPTFILQPILKRIVIRIAARHPELFVRLGAHTQSRFVIDPIDFPFALFLLPDPKFPCFRAVPRMQIPIHEAKISGRFLTLMRLVDADVDGDALFFSRELVISGNTEAVVCLRNALDDVDRSIAQDVADMFGPLGRIALSSCRKAAQPSTLAETR